MAVVDCFGALICDGLKCGTTNLSSESYIVKLFSKVILPIQVAPKTNYSRE